MTGHDSRSDDLRAAYRTTERAIVALNAAWTEEGIAKAALKDACAEIGRLRAENEGLRERIELLTGDIER